MPKPKQLAKIPAWICNTPRERASMVAWVNRMLDEELARAVSDMQSEEAISIYEEEFPYLVAKSAADSGDINAVLDYLREHPGEDLETLKTTARLKARRGRPAGARAKDFQNYQFASSDVDRVYRIWKSTYSGRWKRQSAPFVLEIVSERWGVTEDKLAKFRKEHGRVLRD
jgi:hypothetical protein